MNHELQCIAQSPLAQTHFRVFFNEQEKTLARYILEPLLGIPSQIDFLSIWKKLNKRGLKSAYFIR